MADAMCRVNNNCIILQNQIPEIYLSITLVSLTYDIPPISQNQPDCRFIEITSFGTIADIIIFMFIMKEILISQNSRQYQYVTYVVFLNYLERLSIIKII